MNSNGLYLKKIHPHTTYIVFKRTDLQQHYLCFICVTSVLLFHCHKHVPSFLPSHKPTVPVKQNLKTFQRSPDN